MARANFESERKKQKVRNLTVDERSLEYKMSRESVELAELKLKSATADLTSLEARLAADRAKHDAGKPDKALVKQAADAQRRARLAHGHEKLLESIVQLLQGTRVGPILVSIHCDYRQQVSHPDTVQVTASITGIGRTSMVMEHQIYSEQQQMLVSEGSSTLVLFDYAKNEPVPVPVELRQAIESLEGRPLDPST